MSKKTEAPSPDVEPSLEPVVTSAKKPAAPVALTAEQLVEIGLAASDAGVRDSSAACAARRSVLESVAAMMLAAR